MLNPPLFPMTASPNAFPKKQIFSNSNKLLKQLEYVFKNSAFYRSKLGSYFSESNSLAVDFFELPFTTKNEVLDDQKSNPPYGSNLCVSPKDIKRIHSTSGTTNRPLLIAMTKNDIDQTVAVGKKCFSSSGVTERDTVVHCLSYNMWMGGYTDHQSIEASGATVIPFGVGNTNRLIETILNIRPTAIHCTPSYLSKIELILKRDFNLQPIDLGLKLGLFGAESGLQNPNYRKSIEQSWGIKAMNANYGMADVLSMFGSECVYQNGLHFMGGDILFPELIDPQTEESLKIEKDAEGELILTNLARESQPLIRYRTKDVVKILSNESCKCGESGFRFEIIGRSDDMITIKGVNVFVNSIDKIISNHLELLTGVFQIHISKSDPISEILLRIELKPTLSIPEDEFKDHLMLEFKNKLSVKPDIDLLPEGSLPRTEGKSKKAFRSL